MFNFLKILSVAMLAVVLVSFSMVGSFAVSAYGVPEGFAVDSKAGGNVASINGKVYGFIGDSDMNNKINVKDATNIQKALAKIVTLNYVSELLADVNFKGGVNIKDATAIQKWIAKIHIDEPINHILYVPNSSDEDVDTIKNIYGTTTYNGLELTIDQEHSNEITIHYVNDSKTFNFGYGSKAVFVLETVSGDKMSTTVSFWTGKIIPHDEGSFVLKYKEVTEEIKSITCTELYDLVDGKFPELPLNPATVKIDIEYN